MLVPGAIGGVQKAAFTTVDDSFDVTATDPGPHCKNGNPAVNCNIYTGKQYVWLNGGPTAAQLGNGDYFFAVLQPGGQGGNEDPNDGTPKNLSDTTIDPWSLGYINSDGSLAPSGDAWTNREFTITGCGTTGCQVNYFGTHTFDSANNEIRLMPYDDTPNNGGVYIMAICSLANADSSAANAPGVDPSACKYDAFKVQEGTPTTPNAADLSASKDATPSFSRTYTWDISKVADTSKVFSAGGGDSGAVNYTVSVTHDSGTDGSWQVTGTIAVTNPLNAFDVAGVNVVDAVDNGGTCQVPGGSNITVPGFGEVDLPYTCTYSSAPSPSNGTNTATVTWPDIGSPNTSTTATATFDFANATPTIVHGSVDVSDSLHGHLGTVSYTDPSPTDFKYQLTFDDPAGTCTDHTNTATATIGDSSQQINSDPVTVTDCQGADLTVDKTATPQFTRTYNWTIAKAVDKTTVTNSGGSATFNYTVNVNQTGVTDSGWKVTGTITVANPNDWEDITANVGDAINNGGICTVTGGTNAKIPKSSSVNFPYTCTYASAPNPAAFTNTGTANWDGTAASTPHSSASKSVTGAFGAPSSPVNKMITPTDAFNGGAGVNLCVLDPTQPCTLTATDSSPFTSATYHYSRTVTNTGPLTCQSFNNTAATGTGPTSSKTVTVCFFAPVTPGYWKNHLAPSGTSGCNSLPSGTSCGGSAPFASVWANTSQWKCLGGIDNCTGVTTVVGYTGFKVNSITIAANVFSAMSCSFSGNAANQNQQAIGCLTGKLLAAKYNVNIIGSSPCINPVINKADSLLSPGHTVTYGGYTAQSITYTGPSGTYTGITSTGTSNNQRAVAIALQNALDKYDNGGGC